MRLILFGLLYAIIFSTSVVNLQAQSCSNPEQLCALSPVREGDLGQSSPISVSCFDQENTVVYSFTSNSLNAPGSAVIQIDSVVCESANGIENIQALVVRPNSGNPCNTAQWQSMSGCLSTPNEGSLETQALDPSTEYFVVVGAPTIPDSLSCNFRIGIAGPAVEIVACCNTEILLGQGVELNVEGGDDNVGYTWRPNLYLDDNTASTTYSYPEESITYNVRGTIPSQNPNINEACAGESEVTVTVGPPVSIPNTFTPNGDGFNDSWKIKNISSFENSLISVYSRWGQLVYRASGTADAWDGTNNGRFLPMGTYYFVIELNSLDVAIPPITGHVSIIH